MNSDTESSETVSLMFDGKVSNPVDVSMMFTHVMGASPPLWNRCGDTPTAAVLDFLFSIANKEHAGLSLIGPRDSHFAANSGHEGVRCLAEILRPLVRNGLASKKCEPMRRC